MHYEQMKEKKRGQERRVETGRDVGFQKKKKNNKNLSKCIL